MIGVERFISEMKSLHYTVEGPFDSGDKKWAVIKDFLILCGRFAGKTVQIAIAVPKDFPATPPGGLHISPAIVPREEMKSRNIHDCQNDTSKLTGEWQYWSRPVLQGTWTPERPAKRLVAHWNAVMQNVP